MTLEERVTALEKKYKSLSRAYKQMQENQTGTTNKADQTSGEVKAITPYTETKTAYIDDEYVIFNNVPDGNVSVFMIDNNQQNVPCTFEKINGNIKVSFEKRTSLATVTVVIQ